MHVPDLQASAALPIFTGHFGVDIGPASAATFSEALARCGTIFWNGPMGKFEVPAFDVGTRTVAQAVAAATKAGATSVVGGADESRQRGYSEGVCMCNVFTSVWWVCVYPCAWRS